MAKKNVEKKNVKSNVIDSLEWNKYLIPQQKMT